MSLTEYTHLLNYSLWFSESTIQSLLNGFYNGNLSEQTVLEKTTVDKLVELRELLVVPFTYMFQKPDVTSPLISPVLPEDVVVAATWTGVTKDLIQVTPGGAPIFNNFKQKAWSVEHETGLYHDTFENGDHTFVGMAIQLLDVVIVILVKTRPDNSVPPSIPPPTPPRPRKDCKIDGVPICYEPEPEPTPDCHVEFHSIH